MFVYVNLDVAKEMNSKVENRCHGNKIFNLYIKGYKACRDVK